MVVEKKKEKKKEKKNKDKNKKSSEIFFTCGGTVTNDTGNQFNIIILYRMPLTTENKFSTRSPH